MTAANQIAEHETVFQESVQAPVSDPEDFSGMVGRGASFKRLLHQMRSAAPHLRIAAIEGEPGSGKSTVAEQLWLHGPLKAGTLVVVRASDLNQRLPLIDRAEKWTSLCKSARRGMLLLEDIDQLSPEGQATILEYLRSEDASRSSFRSFGHSSGDESYMQLVVTSSRSLRGLVGAGSFSRELAYRVTAMRFVLAPLRERREDISALADFFVEKYAAKHGKAIRGLDPAALGRLLNHKWPGNVRELESVIEAACLEVHVQWIRAIDLRLTPNASPIADVIAPAARTPGLKSTEDLTLETAVRNHIAEILKRTHGNKLRTARLLGISRSTLYRMLQGGATT